MTIEDTLESVVEVLDGCGTQLVEDVAHLFAYPSVRIGYILRDNQEAIKGLPGLTDIQPILALVTQISYVGIAQ